MKDFLKSSMTKEHEDHEALMEWIGGSFDPEYFNGEEVWFDDPKERWEFAFGDGDQVIDG